MKFLDDAAESIRDEWRAGNNWTDKSRYEVETYKQVQTIGFDDIEQFYEEDDEQDNV